MIVDNVDRRGVFPQGMLKTGGFPERLEQRYPGTVPSKALFGIAARDTAARHFARPGDRKQPRLRASLRERRAQSTQAVASTAARGVQARDDTDGGLGIACQLP